METIDAGNENLVRSWASELDPNAREQAKRSARSAAVAGPVALMADAHFGMGATVGSVIPTEGAIIPAAVGVDIGCGMAAFRVNRTADDLPDDLSPLLSKIGSAIPAGLGKWNRESTTPASRWLAANPAPNRAELDRKVLRKAGVQLGTLGSGNHFVEVSLDEAGRVWGVLHSGSRGVGNQLAQRHIKEAERACGELERLLEDRDLAYFVASDPGYQAYIDDMLWAQSYALQNRELMIESLAVAMGEAIGGDDALRIEDVVRCHHNYTEQETHIVDGEAKTLWITRKGAIRAEQGDRGVIPGSMGTSSYVVEGRGNPDSYNSASHGAGRRMSRNQARKAYSGRDLKRVMGNRTWLEESASKLVDEAPMAYKKIEKVMKDQADLVKILHKLEAVCNYKGV